MPDAIGRKTILVEMARELGMRRALYPKWIKAQKLSADDAEKRITLLQAAYDYVSETMPQNYAPRDYKREA